MAWLEVRIYNSLACAAAQFVVRSKVVALYEEMYHNMYRLATKLEFYTKQKYIHRIDLKFII